MTTVEMPTERFRLSMLIYDTRYRSLTIQVFALLAFMLAAAWLVNNTVQNLAALGKDLRLRLPRHPRRLRHQPDADPLHQRQHPRPRGASSASSTPSSSPSSAASSRRSSASLIGVLRLSPNWLVSKLAGIYVDVFRNVPGAALDPRLHGDPDRHGAGAHRLPRRERHRARCSSARSRSPTAASTSPGRSSRPAGSSSSAIFALSLSPIIAFGRYAKRAAGGDRRDPPDLLDQARRSSSPRRSSPTCSPAAPISFDFPELQRFNFEGGGFIDKSLIALWLALALLHRLLHRRERARRHPRGLARPDRGGGARSGSGPNRIMSLVVLPQALRVIIPPLISQYLNLTKNSSLAIAVGYMDARATLGGITMNQTGRELECMLLLMGFYLIVSLLDLLGDELVQRARRAEGAVRWPTSPTSAARCSRPRRRRRSQVGIVGWLREKLFSSWLNAILTILCLYGLWSLVGHVLPWFAHAVWNAGSLTECREIIKATWGEGAERRLLRGHPRALEAVPLRLLPQHHVLAADARLRAPARRAGAGARRRAAAQAALVLDRLPRHLLLAALGRLALGADPRSTPASSSATSSTARSPAARLEPHRARSPRCSRPLLWWLYLVGPIAGALASVLPLALTPVDLQALRRLHAVDHHRHDRHRLLAAARHPARARPAVGHAHRQVALASASSSSSAACR